MSVATTQQLNDAANKLAMANKTYAKLTSKQIIEQSRTNPALASQLQQYLPKGTTITAPAAKFTLPDPNARIRSVMDPKGGASDQVSDPATGTQYYLYPITATTAQWFSVPKGSTLATPVNPTTLASTGSGMTLNTLTANRSKFYDTNKTGVAQQAAQQAEANRLANAAANKAAADKAAADKAAADKAAAAKTVAANAAKIQQTRNDFVNNVVNNDCIGCNT
jgi:phage tail protein X